MAYNNRYYNKVVKLLCQDINSVQLFNKVKLIIGKTVNTKMGITRNKCETGFVRLSFPTCCTHPTLV